MFACLSLSVRLSVSVCLSVTVCLSVGGCLMICLSLAERVEFNEVNTHMLENWIDEMTAQLPPLKNFILPVSLGIGWDGVSVGVFPCWILCVCVCVYLCLHVCVCVCVCVCICLVI